MKNKFLQDILKCRCNRLTYLSAKNWVRKFLLGLNGKPTNYYRHSANTKVCVKVRLYPSVVIKIQGSIKTLIPVTEFKAILKSFYRCNFIWLSEATIHSTFFRKTELLLQIQSQFPFQLISQIQTKQYRILWEPQSTNHDENFITQTAC